MKDPKDIVEFIIAGAAQKIAHGITIASHFERPRNPDHGDFASSIALQLSRPLKRKPRELAEEIIRLSKDEIEKSGVCEPLEIAGPGFINIRLKSAAKTEIIPKVLAEGPAFGRANTASPQKTMVEFVSANPTGPLHVGHGRQAALGDAIAALLESQGHAVTREFYYNDAGAQIEALARSVQARAKGVGPGQPGWPTLSSPRCCGC